MTFAQNVLLILHFVGLASLLGGFLVQLRTTPRVINNAMFHGALLQLITGILLVAVIEMQKNEPGAETINNTIMGIKLVVLLIITALIVVNRKKEQISNAIWLAIGLLTLLNIVIAVYPGVVQSTS
jgi:cytochrome bd-type quinol oxidase subunit 2